MPQSTPIAALCGLVALCGCAGVVVADVIAIMVYESHDPISETISNLARGPYGWIQDWGLYCLAAAAVALAIGIEALPFSRAKSVAIRALFVAQAGVIVAIAGVNQDLRVTAPGSTLHLICVLALYAIIALVSFLAAGPFMKSHPRHGWTIAVLGFVWTLVAPLFFIVPTAWDGAYERGLAVIAIAWFVTFAHALIRARPAER